MRTTPAIMDLSRALAPFGVGPMRCRADGRFSLHYNGDARLDIHALPDARLVLEVVLIELPDAVESRCALIERALRFSVWRMPHRHDTLCLAPGGNALLLQGVLPAGAGPAAWAGAIERFLNAADAWQAALRTEVRARPGGGTASHFSRQRPSTAFVP